MKILQMTILVLFAYMMCGCATNSYLGDRKNDAADIITISVGIGGGGKARVGPLQVGALVNRDLLGLRGGSLGYWHHDDYDLETIDCDFACFPIFAFGFESFDNDELWRNDRNKDITAVKTLPFVSLLSSAEDDREWDFSREYFHYYTQVEVVLAVGVSIRAGVNFGELIDFILGWFMVDIFKDDKNQGGRADRGLELTLSGK